MEGHSYSSDVWSIGCILFELCTLQTDGLFSAPPGQIYEDIRELVLHADIPPLPPRYSDDLHTLFGMMLQRDPAKRPTTKELLMLPAVRVRARRRVRRRRRGSHTSCLCAGAQVREHIPTCLPIDVQKELPPLDWLLLDRPSRLLPPIVVGVGPLI